MLDFCWLGFVSSRIRASIEALVILGLSLSYLCMHVAGGIMAFVGVLSTHPYGQALFSRPGRLVDLLAGPRHG